MWLSVSLPLFGAGSSARLAQVHRAEGAHLAKGDNLLDLTVDLSAGVTRDCPPVSTCRVTLREEAWLRSIVVAPEGRIEEGAVLALLSTDPDSPQETPAREARVTVAAVLHHADWWA